MDSYTLLDVIECPADKVNETLRIVRAANLTVRWIAETANKHSVCVTLDKQLTKEELLAYEPIFKLSDMTLYAEHESTFKNTPRSQWKIL
jgi:uncharacterized protein YbaR (Trm112 family)